MSTTNQPSLKDLEQAFNGQATLSLYLPIRPNLNAPQGYRAEALDVLREAKQHVSPEQTAAYEVIAARLLDYIRTEYSPSGKTLALFATEAGIISRFDLSLELPGIARMRHGCYLAPLAAALENNPVVVIGCVDDRADRIIVASLGDIEGSQSHLDDVPGRQRKGGWAAFRYERDRAQHVQAHVTEFAERLHQAAQEHAAAWIVLGGAAELTNVVVEALPLDTRHLIAGSFALEMFASDEHLVEEGLVVAAQAADKQEQDLAIRIIDEAKARGNGCLGWDETRLRLAEGRVHELALPVSALGQAQAELALVLAWDSDAKVNFIGPGAAALLEAYGGTGAILRY